MAYLQLEGLRMHYLEEGRGDETILLVHGNVASSEYWERFIKGLPSRYRALAMDLRGCGKTEHVPSGYTIPQFVEDIHQFTRELDLKSFHHIGHSMGGIIAMLYALTYPKQVQSLGLLDSVPAEGLFFLTDEVRAAYRLLANDRDLMKRTMMEAVMPYGEGPSFAGRAAEIAFSCAPQVLLENPESMSQTKLLSEVPKITAPTLIMHGKDDAVIPLEYMVPTMKAMGDAQVAILTRCGHSPQVERPQEFSEIYLNFLFNRKRTNADNCG